MRVIAVDWSGRARDDRRFIWLAEVRDDALTRLENGRSRDDVARHLIELAASDRELIVGFDFSFSFPSWFIERRGYANVEELWRAAPVDGERWLARCEPPFWGRPGRPRPELQSHLRATEAEMPSYGGVRPKSTFQIGGAGSVGTASIRGFPVLAQLRGASFAIWPFDTARLPLVVEVWPRACTGAVVKSDRGARAALLDRRYSMLPTELRERAVASQDAFDAAITALVMARFAEELAVLGEPRHPAAQLEGWAWVPAPGLSLSGVRNAYPPLTRDEAADHTRRAADRDTERRDRTGHH